MVGDIRDEIVRRVLLVDGAMGTMLLAAGLPAGHAAMRWVLERPDAVADVHAAYAAAGADVITTCTFGASPATLRAQGLAGRCDDLQHQAVALARDAAGPGRWVAGNIGPSFDRDPRQPLADDGARLRDEVAAQAAALAAAGADLLLVETMYDLDEARLALAACLSTGLPVIVSMTFGAPGSEDGAAARSLGGDEPGAAAAALAVAGAHGVGANCSLAPVPMVAVARRIVAAVNVPVLVQPNAGQPGSGGTGARSYAVAPEAFAATTAELVAAGARLVGGCCGTTPEHTAAQRRVLDGLA